MRILPLLILGTILLPLQSPCAAAESPAPVLRDGMVAKTVLDASMSGSNRLAPDRWRPYETGFSREANAFVCDAGKDPSSRRGATQFVELNQSRPDPIVASAWSKAEGVGGSPGGDYSVYVDLTFDDGTPLYGQTASFDVGTHDWQRRQVMIVPPKPVKRLSFYTLFRNHAGKVWFRDPELRVIEAKAGAQVFDGVPVVPRAPASGFQVRDVAAHSDFVAIRKQALGLEFTCTESAQDDATFFDLTLRDTTGKDRAVTLLYAVPAASAGAWWYEHPDRKVTMEPDREYTNASQFHLGSSGRISYYPLAAVGAADERAGTCLAIDMARPAAYRIGAHTGTGELYLAYDIGLSPQKPAATLRFCRFPFDARWGFRAALARYYAIFPQAFAGRVSRQGLWMPFAKISEVKGWEDFGFLIKEGDNETAWDDAHGILTFRYTEPMTWWMRMPKSMPRTIEAATAEAQRLAKQGDRAAQALLTSGYHDRQGRFAAMILDTPWCDGAVWSMNSMPGIPGEVTDFKNKWNPSLAQRLYGPKRRGDLDGEYIDSSEGYVTDELDFRRDHFAASQTPLVFSSDDHRPAIFRGLVAFEYAQGIAADVRGRGKAMMANSTPVRLCWLAPLLDVMGTETDWNPGGQWRPMSIADLLYRRALCKGKPFCFLMNSEFERFSHALVEKYMKRSLAFGMFPGFFSHNASQGHYFTRPELYNRDRPLFKKYVPLCKLVAEAGWEPIPKARTSDERLHVERFGSGTPWYLTVFNDSPQPRTATITLEGSGPASSRELVRGQTVSWQGGKATITLESEDVLVLEMQ